MNDVVSTFSIHSRQNRNNQQKLSQNSGYVQKGLTIRKSINVKIWLNEIMNRKNIELKLGKLDTEFKQQKQSLQSNEILLPHLFGQQSQMFPMLCFQKKTCRQLMRESRFDKNVISLPPNDKRNQILFGLLKELMKEINFQQHNILICQNKITKVFYIYFTDNELCPISKCCLTSVVFILGQTFGGQIHCNNELCPLKILATFEIQEQLLWKRQFQDDFSSQLSKYIISGKFRTKSLKSSISQNESQTERLQTNGKNISLHKKNYYYGNYSDE